MAIHFHQTRVPRQRYAPTDADRANVRTRAGLGQPHAAIARNLQISEATLYRYYKEELSRGVEDANVQVSRSLFDMATGRELQEDGTYKRVPPNIGAAIWWSKTRMRWQEPAREGDGTSLTVVTSGTANASTEVVHFYLPPNERDKPDPLLIEGTAETSDEEAA